MDFELNTFNNRSTGGGYGFSYDNTNTNVTYTPATENAEEQFSVQYSNFESNTEGIFTYADEVGTDELTAQERINVANDFLKLHQNDKGEINVETYAHMSALTCIMDEETMAIKSQLVDTDGDGFFDSIEYYDIDGNGTRQFDEQADGILDTQTEFTTDENDNTVKTTYSLDEDGNKGEVIDKSVKSEDGWIQKETFDEDNDNIPEGTKSYEYIYDKEGNIIKVKVTTKFSDGSADKIEYKKPEEIKNFKAN